MQGAYFILAMAVGHLCSPMLPGYATGGTGIKALIRLAVMAAAYATGYVCLTLFVRWSGHRIT